MSRNAQLQAGHLLTREERYQLRLLAQDLGRQILRATDPVRLGVLEQQLANVEMERKTDRACRPRRPRKSE